MALNLDDFHFAAIPPIFESHANGNEITNDYEGVENSTGDGRWLSVTAIAETGDILRMWITNEEGERIFDIVTDSVPDATLPVILSILHD